MVKKGTSFPICPKRKQKNKEKKTKIENERKNLVKDNVKKTLDTLINLGYTNDEILSLVEEILREDNNE